MVKSVNDKKVVQVKKSNTKRINTTAKESSVADGELVSKTPRVFRSVSFQMATEDNLEWFWQLLVDKKSKRSDICVLGIYDTKMPMIYYKEQLHGKSLTKFDLKSAGINSNFYSLFDSSKKFPVLFTHLNYNFGKKYARYQTQRDIAIRLDKYDIANIAVEIEIMFKEHMQRCSFDDFGEFYAKWVEGKIGKVKRLVKVVQTDFKILKVFMNGSIKRYETEIEIILDFRTTYESMLRFIVKPIPMQYNDDIILANIKPFDITVPLNINYIMSKMAVSH